MNNPELSEEAKALLSTLLTGTVDDTITWDRGSGEYNASLPSGHKVSLYRSSGKERDTATLSIKPQVPGMGWNGKASTLVWNLPGEEETWRGYLPTEIVSAVSWHLDRASKKISDQETLLECRMYAERYQEGQQVMFLEQYPGPDADFEEYYRDQAPYSTQYAHMSFGAVYTPHGIRGIDSWFGRQIRSLGKRDDKILTESDVTPEELRIMILANPHLHDVIKTNLLHNLSNYEKNA